jgi:hypothetical protein
VLFTDADVYFRTGITLDDFGELAGLHSVDDIAADVCPALFDGSSAQSLAGLC